MKNQDHYRIVPLEMAITLIAMIIGVGILTIPRGLAQELETPDGWISIILGGLLAMILVFLYTRLQNHFPGKNLIEYIGEGRIGKWIASVTSILFILYFVSILAFEARILAIVVSMYLLSNTPSEVTVALILLATTYAVTKGTQGIIHLNLLFTPFVLLVLFIVLTFTLPDMTINEIRPIMPKGVGPVLLGVKQTILSFLGIEILFFFMANMKPADLRSLPLNLGIGIILVSYTLVTVVSYCVFSLNTTMLITFPTVELAKEILIPGGIFERVESLMITVWIMSIFNTMAIVHLLAVQTIQKQFFKKKSAPWLPVLVTFIAFNLAFVPPSITEAFKMGDWVAWFGFSLVAWGLFIGSLLVWMRSRKKSKQRTEER